MTTGYTPLTTPQFQDLLDIHGSNLEHWPELDRKAAEAFLQNSAPGQEAMRRAEALDRLLAVEMTVQPASRMLRDRVRALPLQHPMNVVPFRAPAKWAAPRARLHVPLLIGEQLWATGAAAAVAAGLLGLVLGIGGLAQRPSPDDPLNISELVFAVPDTVQQDMQ